VAHYFIDKSMQKGGRVEIPDPLARHLGGSLRVRVGELLRLVCGDRWLTVRVEDVRRGMLAGVVQEDVALPSESVSITLAMGVPKGRKLDDVVRHAVELGVRRVIPVYTRRSVPVARERPVRDERLAAITLEAAQQSGRFLVPEVLGALSLEAFILQHRQTGGPGVVLWEGETGTPLAQVLRSAGPEMTVFVGPEGGLEREEVDALRSAGFRSASFGPFILRTETAALAAVAAAWTLMGPGNSA